MTSVKNDVTSVKKKKDKKKKRKKGKKVQLVLCSGPETRLNARKKKEKK